MMLISSLQRRHFGQMQQNLEQVDATVCTGVIKLTPSDRRRRAECSRCESVSRHFGRRCVIGPFSSSNALLTANSHVELFAKHFDVGD